jgi:DNA-binding GntR family transcriptional regulator
MIEADMRFHRFLYELCGNPMIAETAALHWQHIRRLIGGYLQHYPMRNVWDEHQAILEAVMAGDADRAEAAARQHADNAAAKFVALVAGSSAARQETAPGKPARQRRKTS